MPRRFLSDIKLNLNARFLTKRRISPPPNVCEIVKLCQEEESDYDEVSLRGNYSNFPDDGLPHTERQID